MRIINKIVERLEKEKESLRKMILKINSEHKEKLLITVIIVMVYSIIIIIILIMIIIIFENNIREINILPQFEGNMEGLKNLLWHSQNNYSEELIEAQKNKMLNLCAKEEGIWIKKKHEETCIRIRIIKMIFNENVMKNSREYIEMIKLHNYKEIIKELQELRDNVNNDYTEKQKKIITEFIEKFLKESEWLEKKKEAQNKQLQEIIRKYEKSMYIKRLDKIPEYKEQEQKLIEETAKKATKAVYKRLIEINLDISDEDE